MGTEAVSDVPSDVSYLPAKRGKEKATKNGILVNEGDENSLPVYQAVKNGKPVVKDGKPVYVPQDYDLLNAPGIVQHSGSEPENTTKPDYENLAYVVTGPAQKKIDAAIDSGAVDAAANQLTERTKEYLQDPAIAAGQGWYSRMRENLLKAVGEEGRETLSQLLGATSAKTPVNENFLQAMDAYEGIKQGKYEQNRKDYLEMMAAEENGTLDDLISKKGYVDKVLQQATDLSNAAKKLKGKKKVVALAEAKKLRDLAKKPEEDRTKKDRYSLTILGSGLMPKRSNGKKFNANSMAVMKVIAGTWLGDKKGAPKTPNFAGNLSGRTVQATIDVWAARALRELLYKGSNQPWRIQPKSESAVSNQDFALGQVIMGRAAEKLGMNPDDLQAVLWFAEKHHWEANGWTGDVGAEKSSFDDIFKVFFPEGKKPLSFEEASQIFKAQKDKGKGGEEEETLDEGNDLEDNS
jgi:hypothetical protein